MKAIVVALIATANLAMAASSDWMTNLELAKAKAKKENKALLIDVTGSDWCHWCKVLKKEVFSKSSFLKEAKKDFVLVELDFPQKAKQSPKLKAQNKKFAEKYKIKGFPTVILMTADGKVFKRTGYEKGGPKPYLAMLKKSLKAKNFR